MPEVPDPLNVLDTTRREFVCDSMATAVALGLWPVLSASEALDRDGKRSDPPTPLSVLTTDEAMVYDAWCDQLAPGAAQAGASRYLEAQLAAAREEALLFLRVLANPPFEDFYRESLASIEQEVRARYGDDASYASLSDTQRREIIDAAAADKTVAWESPPPSFFFFVSRGDAIDVVYGTEAGFRRLHVPYLAHIRPPTPW